ncbi:MATE family efflux transporter [Synergistaceae bacterium OttesenSCG-928-I11]|nr:MATE family efflux transporter [Synergistaceae bacterium OttesenSCG-928-I11]
MERNMTVGREWRVILAFALPIMGTNLLQTMYTLADSLIVGNFIGPTALGAVGLTAPPTWLLLAFCLGIGTGASIVIAQYYGAGRETDIHATIGGAYALSLIVSLVLTLCCFLVAKPLIWVFLGAPTEMRDMSVTYFRIYASGIVVQMLYNVTYGILRAYGNSRGGLYFLLVAAIMNVALDLLFIVHFGWGVAGAAIATVLSQLCAALASMLYLVRSFPHLRPRFGFGGRERGKMRTISIISAPIIVQQGIFAVGFTIMQRLVNSFGPHSIEGYAAMMRIENLAHIPSNSFNTAISAFTGQNIGSGKHDRAQMGYRASLRMGAIVTVLIAAAVLFFARDLLALFNISGESMRRGLEHLVLLMFFIILSMTTNITSGFLQGAGDVQVPTIAGFANLAVRLCGAYLMAGTFISFRCLYVSMPPAWAVGCLIVVLRYRSGKWRQKALV